MKRVNKCQGRGYLKQHNWPTKNLEFKEQDIPLSFRNSHKLSTKYTIFTHKITHNLLSITSIFGNNNSWRIQRTDSSWMNSCLRRQSNLCFILLFRYTELILKIRSWSKNLSFWVDCKQRIVSYNYLMEISNFCEVSSVLSYI